MIVAHMYNINYMTDMMFFHEFFYYSNAIVIRIVVNKDNFIFIEVYFQQIKNIL